MIFTAILVNFVELITIWGFLGVGIPPFLNTLVGGVDVLEGHNRVLGVIGKVTLELNIEGAVGEKLGNNHGC
jgi:hypothetical protein